MNQEETHNIFDQRKVIFISGLHGSPKIGLGKFINNKVNIDTNIFLDPKFMRLKFNDQLDTLYTRSYSFGDSLDFVPYYLLPEGNDHFIIVGNISNDDLQKVSLGMARFDTDFELQWESHQPDDLPTEPGGYLGYHIMPTGDGYLIGGSVYYPAQASHKGIIARTDLQGNFLWVKSISLPNLWTSALRIGERSDGTYFYIGSQDIDTSIIDYSDPARLRFGIFNKAGSILKDTIIGPLMDRFGVDIFRPSPDGNFLIGGHTFGDRGINSHLLKLDEDGNSLWQRFYYHAYPEALSRLDNLQFTPDGGFIMSGRFADLQRVYGGPVYKHTWLLKTDEYGCVTAGCQNNVNLAEPVKISAYTVYPNPSSGLLYLQWQNGALQPDQVELYNLQGQKVWQQQVEPLMGVSTQRLQLPASLPPAHYLLLMQHKGQLLQRENLQLH